MAHPLRFYPPPDFYRPTLYGMARKKSRVFYRLSDNAHGNSRASGARGVSPLYGATATQKPERQFRRGLAERTYGCRQTPV